MRVCYMKKYSGNIVPKAHIDPRKVNALIRRLLRFLFCERHSSGGPALFLCVRLIQMFLELSRNFPNEPALRKFYSEKVPARCSRSAGPFTLRRPNSLAAFCTFLPALLNQSASPSEQTVLPLQLTAVCKLLQSGNRLLQFRSQQTRNCSCSATENETAAETESAIENVRFLFLEGS